MRADAITALASLNPEDYQEIFAQGMADSSYAVAGASIMAYAQTDAADKAQRFEPFAEYKNFNVVISLSDYYVEAQVPGKYDWFTNKLTQVDNQTLYYLLNYFGRYLLFQDLDTQRKGTVMLAKYAQFHPTYYVRLTAYRTLGLFSDLPGVAQRRTEIRNEEKDKRLQLFYQSNP